MSQDLITTRKLNQTLGVLRQIPGNAVCIPLIQGKPGAGKSSLLQLLLRKAPKHWAICQLSATSAIDQSQLLKKLAKDWLDSAPLLPPQLGSALATLAQSGKVPLLLVDDAEQLPPEILNFLLKGHQQGVFSLMLFATPGLEKPLQAQLPAESLTSLWLAPWNREEIQAYWQYRDRPPLSPQKLDKLWQSSQGLPERVQAALDKTSAQSRTSLWLPASGFLLLLIISGLAAWLFQPNSPSVPETRPPTQPIPDTPSQPQAEKPQIQLTESVEPELPALILRLHDHQWLLQQPPEAFTLELGRFDNIDALRLFILNRHLEKESGLAWFRSRQSDVEKFVLLLGQYPNKRQALRERLLIPESLDPERIPLRNFADIQQDIRRGS